MAAGPGAGDLGKAHDDSRQNQDIPPEQEYRQRHDVAGEIHHLGVAGGPLDIHTRYGDKRHGPEAAGSRSEKSVVKSDNQSEYAVERHTAHALPGLQASQVLLYQHVDEQRQQDHRNHQIQKARIEQLDRNRPDSRANQREGDAREDFPEADQAAVTVSEGGGQASETCLEFVGGDGLMGGEPGEQEQRDGDHPAAAGDGVDETGGIGPQNQDGVGENRSAFDHSRSIVVVTVRWQGRVEPGAGGMGKTGQLKVFAVLSVTMDIKTKQKLAELALKVGLDFQKDQCLQIMTGVGTYDYAREIAKKAYEMGGRLVRVMLSDNELTKSRAENSTKENLEYFPRDMIESGKMQLDESWARIRIDSTEELNVLKGVDSEALSTMTRVARSNLKFVSDQLMRHKHPWLVLAAPGPEWARTVYGLADDAPQAEVDAALKKLEEVYISILRLDKDDPVAVWKEHGRNLASRGKTLDGHKLDRVRFTSPDTDLTVALAPTHTWLGGPSRLPDGRWYEPNLPTEEVFTTPDFRRTEGHVKVVKPVKVMETMVEGAWFKFEKGKVVDFGAEKGADIMKKFFAMDEGASYLGEVALVDVDSPINRSGLVFGSILFDENASCHIALGQGYPSCLTNADELAGADDLKEAGCNVSMLHTDFMISDDKTDVTGYTADGAEVPIIKGGKFVI
jgi:aminopeptidase